MFALSKQHFIWIILFLVVVLAGFLRIYKLSTIPPSLSWDEASVGYNAWTIANYGKDEWGNTLPLAFKAFGEFKMPFHIYTTALFVKIAGLNEFTTRFESALFGVINIVLIFFLVQKLFQKKMLSLLSAFVLAVSPYNITFSRFNHELNISLFFFMTGLLLFMKSVKNNAKYLPWSLLLLGFSAFSYNGAKVFIPIIILVLGGLYIKPLLKSGRNLIFSGLVIIFFLGLLYFNPGLSGLMRYSQTSFDDNMISNTQLYQKTHNRLLGTVELIGQQYFKHFQYKYLFESGESNARHSVQTVGVFYKPELLFLVLGLVFLALNRRRESILVIIWMLLGPLASSIAKDAPHQGRSLFITGSWHIVVACGIYYSYYLVKKVTGNTRQLRIMGYGVLAVVVVLSYFFSVAQFTTYYFNDYSKKYAIDWQYGMKDVASFVRDRNGYFQVYMTETRYQPYIYYLYYLHYALPKYLSTVVHNEKSDKEVNNVLSFDKYHFGDWDKVKSPVNPGTLYILTPSEYDGLLGKPTFSVKRLIRYPDGTNAFFLVSYP